MSTFTPLNLNSDSRKVDEEEENQTKELQVEEGFKLFQQCLELQRQKQYELSERGYKQLCKLDVLKPRYNEPLTPSIRTLRYLTFKNRGLLSLEVLRQRYQKTVEPEISKDSKNPVDTTDKLKNKQETNNQPIDVDDEVEDEELLEELTRIITDLTNALGYSKSADDDLVDVLFELYMYFDNLRLARLLLEDQLSRLISENDFFQGGVYSPSRSYIEGYLPPPLLKLFSRLNLVLNAVHDTSSVDRNVFLKPVSQKKIQKAISKFQGKVEQKLICFNKLKQIDKTYRFENLHEIDDIVIELGIMSFPELVTKVEKLYENSNRATKTNSNSINAFYNTGFSNSTYTYNDPLHSSKFDTTDRVVIEVCLDTNTVELAEDEIKTDKQTKKNGPQRSSKRFRGSDENAEMSIKSFTELHDELSRFELILSSLDVDASKVDNVFNKLVERYIDDENGVEVVEDRMVTNSRQLIHDFNFCLKNWDKQKSSIIFGMTSKPTGKPRGKQQIVMEIFRNANGMKNVKSVEKKNSPDTSLIVDKLLKSFIDKINSRNFNIYQIRFLLLVTLLENQTEINGHVYNLIVDHEFDQKENFLLDIKKYIDYYQSQIHTKLRHVLFWAPHQVDLGPYFNMVVAIIEILVDDYVSLNNTIEHNEKLGPKELNEKIGMKRKLEHKIESWIQSADCSLNLKTEGCNRTLARLYWAIFLYKDSGNSTGWDKHYVSLLRKKPKGILQLLLEMEENTLNVYYMNYKNYAPLSKSTIDEALKKINVFESLARLMNTNTEGLETIDCEEDTDYMSPEMINLLDGVLLDKKIMTVQEKTGDLNKGEDFTSEGAHQTIYKFVRESSFETQLKLRQVLFDYYYQNIMEGHEQHIQSYRDNVEIVLSEILLNLNSTLYAELAEEERHEKLLTVLRYSSDVFTKFISILEKRSWKLPGTTKAEALLNILQIASVLMVFYLNKVSVNLTENSFVFPTVFPKAAKELQDMIVNSFIMLYVYLKPMFTEQPERNICEMVSNMHALLGYGAMCDASSGKFLNLLEKELLSAKRVYVDMEIFQLMSCKYHLPLTTDYFMPYEHHTAGGELSRDSALALSQRFLSLVFEKKDPYFHSIKNDLKAILDAFHAVIGDPDMRYERIMRADAVIETYLDSSLTAPFFRDAFYGLLGLDISQTRLDVQDAADHGLYYVQGVMALSLFKIRKRSMQGRSAELDYVIKMFKADLLCGTNRLESWILLGQSYSFLVEDDLIWTSDKLNSEKKKNTAMLQKRAMLCYAMAISIYAHLSEEAIAKSRKMISLLWSLFSKEMYNSAMKPMSKLCYEFSTTPKILYGEKGYQETHYEQPLRDQSVYKTTLLAFRMALKFKDQDWSNYYYIANLEVKLSITNAPSAILKLLKSCMLARKTSSSETIIEPHYRLASLVYKSVKQQIVSIDHAVGILKLDNHFYQYDFPDKPPETYKQFAQLCVGLQRKILSHDKKKWHHKPHYRIAKIYFDDLHDVEKAKEEMMNLITLKLTNKNLVTIWKPENERPGKHFIYAYDYVNFFVQLLEQSDALSSLCLAIRKLRRFGSGMVNMINAWENACHTACQLIRKRLGIPKNYTDFSITQLSYPVFIKESQDFLAELKAHGSDIIDETTLMLLYEISEIRRMNNGFATTAEIDDTFAAIYLMIFLKFVDSRKIVIDKPLETPQKIETDTKTNTFVFETGLTSGISTVGPSTAATPAPTVAKHQDLPKTSSTKSKVARRDLYPRAIAILKLLAKDIEELQKKYELKFDAKPKTIQDSELEPMNNNIESNTIKSDIINDAIKSDAIKSDANKDDTIKSDNIRSDSIKSDSIKSDTNKSNTIKSSTTQGDATKDDTINNITTGNVDNSDNSKKSNTSNNSDNADTTEITGQSNNIDNIGNSNIARPNADTSNNIHNIKKANNSSNIHPDSSGEAAQIGNDSRITGNIFEPIYVDDTDKPQVSSTVESHSNSTVKDTPKETDILVKSESQAPQLLQTQTKSDSESDSEGFESASDNIGSQGKQPGSEQTTPRKRGRLKDCAEQHITLVCPETKQDNRTERDNEKAFDIDNEIVEIEVIEDEEKPKTPVLKKRKSPPLETDNSYSGNMKKFKLKNTNDAQGEKDSPIEIIED